MADAKPTDAEIDAVLCSHWPAFWWQSTLVRMWLRDAVREAIAKWGQPAHSGEPVAKLGQAAQAFVLDPTSLQKKLHLEAQAWGPLAEKYRGIKGGQNADT